MYLYNETIGIDKDIETEWLRWITEKYLPGVMETGMFSHFKIYKVLHDAEDGTISYSIQYIAPSVAHVQQYLEIYGPPLIAEHREKFRDKHVVFRTLLEEIR
jgi:hypothetical protein